ncbi:uncharacterized protein LOC128886392 isoform X1 [Hylaeus anthracinus]|uniref:uncharacterized protein LOC128886392 isoform X1 n=1 Tax=Hylaeus anthracinus TaxID=313031 RepID=UPI0023B97BFA|nr:uncharacterized protein LOC128886392 isoform X1 [Hylaeus anthracinus]
MRRRRNIVIGRIYPDDTGLSGYKIVDIQVLSVRNCAASSDTNSTKLAVEEEDDESLEKTRLDEFKERYRRLIPYLTFYVVNNIDGEQVPTQQGTAKDSQSSPSAKQNLQLSARFLNVPRKGTHRTNVQSQERKFVPSVQYDPHSLGSDNDYFMPVRYNSKVSYDDYLSPSYQTYQDRKTMYPDVPTPTSQVAPKENRYYANVRPLRPYTTHGRNHLPRKQLTNKPSLVRGDYVLDYNARPTSNTNYPIKDYQGHRHIPPSGHSSLPALESITGKPPPMVPQLRNPNVNLDQIIESLHLSERLPEMLNKDNIDVSLKTLVEILNILHNTKNELLEMRPPPLPPLVSPPPRQKVTNFKARPQTRPKVITESRFQATPNPLYLTEDPERYKATSYEDDIKPKVLATPSYVSDGLNNNKVVEYYLPVVQDVSEKGKDVFLPTMRTQVDESSTGHSYEIVEDLSDDVLQQEHYTLSPPTTESSIPSYTEPTKIPQQTNTETKHGATRGEAHVDYPAYSNIPFTNFSCKDQRYKGFFGDPDTGCQVWHYCDLNGGKSSFLCPNGTIFSQVALTCDWWFNVKCETTTQLYVLNERLYKYILPVMPKFPEDFTGPEVDRYLEIKFKEMEKKLKEKLKKEEQEMLKEKAETRKEDE